MLSNGATYYYDENGVRHSTIVDGKQINPQEAKIIFYQNRPVEIHYIDVTDSTANTRLKTVSSTDNGTDLAPITLAHNAETNPDGNSTIERTGDYAYWAYNSDGHKVADTNAYKNALQTLKDEGYVLVKTDVNDTAKSNIDYDAAWSNGSITPYVYTVELRRKATPVTETKQVTRTIHYVANSTDGDELLNDSIQKVNLKATVYLDANKISKGEYSTTPDSTKIAVSDGTHTYYVSASDLVNTETITDADGNSEIVVASGTAQTPTWTIDTSKTNNGTAENSTKFDFAKVDTPDQITDNATGRTDKDKGATWQKVTDANSVTYDANSTDTPADGYVIYDKESTPTPKTYKWTIEYVTAGGDVIKDPVTVGSDYKTGDTYDVTTEGNTYYPTELTGKDGKTYELVPASTTNGSGTFTDGDVTTKLIYKLKENTPTLSQKYTWTVKYVDQDGNVLKPSITEGTNYAGDASYDITNTTDAPATLTIDGQRYDLVKTDNGSGSFNNQSQTTTLTYKKHVDTPTPVQKYSWTIKYVDEDGSVIQDPLTVGSNYVAGDPYNVNSLSESQRPTTITTADGKTYELVTADTVNGQGTFANGDQVTTLIYRLKSIPWTPLTPSTPATPTNPTKPTEPTEPTNPTNPTNPEQPATPSTPAQPSQPNKPGQPAASSTPVTPVAKTTPVTTQAQPAAKKLPQTGNDHESGLVALGLSSVALMLGLAGKKRKED